MNIAIITFSDFNTNYGSILQSYALKVFLESNGHNVIFIRYREYNKSKRQYSVRCLLRKYAIRIYYAIHHNRLKKRRDSFSAFIKQNIPHTSLFTSEVDLEKSLDRYDAYICGSDQIWNLKVLGGLREPYFLKFAPSDSIKIAYAPSLGDAFFPDDLILDITNLLNDFKAISTREKYYSDRLSSTINKSVSTVIDPTLLLNRDEWLGVTRTCETLPKGDYAICYCVRRNKLVSKLVRELIDTYGRIPIYNVSDNLINIPGTLNDYVNCAPDTFIHLVSNAKYTIGTSFHLAAFSTIFDKHCFIAANMHNENRIRNLFQYIGREDHLIYNNLPYFINLDDHIQYDILNHIVDNSKLFLIEGLKRVEK